MYLIKEIMDTVLPFKKINNNNYEFFTTDNNKYLVSFFKMSQSLNGFHDDSFDFKDPLVDYKTKYTTCTIVFELETGDQVSHAIMNFNNRKTVFEVLGTVAKIIKTDISNSKTKLITFTAKEKSRVKLYDHFIKLFEKEGYKFISGLRHNEKCYVFIKT